MASVEPVDDGIVEPGIEPGASTETMLVTDDTFEEYEQLNQTIKQKIDKGSFSPDTDLKSSLDDSAVSIFFVIKNKLIN